MTRIGAEGAAILRQHSGAIEQEPAVVSVAGLDDASDDALLQSAGVARPGMIRNILQPANPATEASDDDV